MSLAQSARRIISLVLILTVTTACFSRNTPAPATDPLPAAEQQDTITQPEATETATTVAQGASNQIGLETNTITDLGTVAVIEEITTIDRYRMRVTMESTVANRGASVWIDGAYIKEPPAEEVTMRVDENGEQQSVTMILVDGLRYMRSGEMVMQTADARMNLQELTLIQPSDVTLAGNNYAVVGEESINGRDTIHYRGGPEAVPTGGTAGDTFDVTQVESASIDLWVDVTERFIVAMAVNVQGFDEEPDARMEMRFDYFDFNSPDIVIAAPADALSMGDGMPSGTDTEDAPTPSNALGALLGFDLLLATGSEITMVSNQIVQVSSIYTLDEAVNLFQAQLPANGYTFLNLITPQAGEQVIMFQKGAHVVTIQMTETATGSDWNVVIAP